LFVTLSPTSYVTALFKNMVFSNKDKVLIENLYQMKGYNARQLRTKFPDKEWTKSSINRLLKKFRYTGTVDRSQGSDRPLSAHMDKNIDQMNHMVLSQEDRPHTQSTDSEM